MWQLSLFITATSLAVVLAQGDNDSQCPVNIPGYFHRGNCDLFCKPANWKDIVAFFSGNYVIYAVAMLPRPGQRKRNSVYAAIHAILFPGFGIQNATRAIFIYIKSRSTTDLQKAAHAGALFAVVRMPEERDERALESQQSQRTLPRNVDSQLSIPRIHGRYKLPPGYDLARVPSGAVFKNDERDDGKENIATICNNHDVFGILASLVQLTFAISTLISTRGDQIERYGYAAFGFTVVPYALMAFINLIGHMVCPRYDSCFIVNSGTLEVLLQTLKDEENQQFVVEGTVGHLQDKEDADLNRAYEQERGKKRDRAIIAEKPSGGTRNKLADMKAGGAMIVAIAIMIRILCVVVLIAIIGGMSGFQPRRSARYQRVWTMMWMILGFVCGYGLPPELIYLDFARVIASALLWSIPIGGYVVVAQMIREFGTCVELQGATASLDT